MSSYNYLVDHALKNVWCTPDQDQQSIVKPARLTPDLGVWTDVEVLRKRIVLPQQGVRFHVYQIGQLHPLFMGLFPVRERWVTFAEACNTQNVIVDLYVNSGVQLPRSQSWYMVTKDRNLIVAVKLLSRVPADLDKEDLFIRVYSNAYFNSVRSDPLDDYVHVEGGLVNTQAKIIALQNKFDQYKQKPGQTYAFVNGFKVGQINLFTVKEDDVVEFVYDSSIKNVIDFRVGGLATFDSIMDLKRKYLLHYEGQGDGEIDYHDDIDFWLIQPTANGGHKGVYYHRNMADAVRMVTHKDYAVCVPYVAAYQQTILEQANLDTVYLRLHIRKSGYKRPLVNEHNRIKELYKLKDLDLRKAMLGVDSVVPNWRADTLEAADYTKIMRTTSEGVTELLVQNAYGYNAISKLVGDTPSFTRIESTLRVIDVPYNLQNGAGAYEYDATGKLIGYYYHPQGAIYAARNQNCNRIEMIAGEPGEDLDEWYGDIETVLDPLNNYRFYVCGNSLGRPDDKWEDVTGQAKYDIVDNKVVWFVDRSQYYTLVRGDDKHLAYSFKVKETDGLINFSLTQYRTINGVRSKYVMSLPLGELDIFLNGRSLIENLDYFVRNKVEIVICNKEYLDDPLNKEQEVTIRFTGFCKDDLTRESPDDVGFVDFGVMSYNRRYDIRDDKVLRIVANGNMYDRSALKFSEDDSGIRMDNVRNGAPYQIRDIVVPLRGLTPNDTYSLREKSREVDALISGYMTDKLPEPPGVGLNAIPERYQIYSPFCQKLIMDLKNGILDDPIMYEQYNDTQIFTLCKSYEYLLEFDPTQEGQAQDDRYVSIHPHNLFSVIDIGIYQYKFLARAVFLYTKGKVNLSNFIRVETF